jgi:hypothetical protein
MQAQREKQLTNWICWDPHVRHNSVDIAYITAEHCYFKFCMIDVLPIGMESL